MPNHYPIVLAHGIAPFNVWSPIIERFLPGLAARSEYFKQIVPALRNAGHEVLTTKVSFAGRLDQRARELGEQLSSYLDQNPRHAKVHIIGHSMGGLDSRCMMASNPEIRKRIASLTTIGTPHNGTPVADFWKLTRNDSTASEKLDALRPILDLEGFKDLTTSACAERNRQWRESEAGNSVFFQTYSSWEEKDAVFPPLRHAWQVIQDKGATDEQRANDGLVPVHSQKWQDPPREIRRHEFPFQSDHLNEIGWWDIAEVVHGNWRPSKFEEKVRAIYLNIARDVAALSDAGVSGSTI
jgi:triacylglycerol lipase